MVLNILQITNYPLPGRNYRIFSIKRRTPKKTLGSNKRWVYRAEFKINAPGVYSGSRRLFEVPAFIPDGYIKSGLCVVTLYINIQTKLPFTKVLLTKTDETNDASDIVSISFKSW